MARSKRINNIISSKIDDDSLGLKKNLLQPGKAIAGATDNIVPKEKLRKVQLETLDKIENSLKHTFGPAASSTVILTGSDADTLVANYSKDGRKCLKHIMFSNPIELSIRTQLDDIVSHVDHEVGDGTTSATLLSSIIFKKLCEMENDKGAAKNPYQVSRDFKTAVKLIQDKILTHKQDFTLDDVYNITYISTNGNEEISNTLTQIYKEYGLDCYIETGISNTQDNQVKIYDGMTLDEGYSDQAYINTNNGRASIRDAKIYFFSDPIDTPEMGVFLDTIITDNIYKPEMNDDPTSIVPTVILAPKISIDMSQTITQLVERLYHYSATGNQMAKPPILIVNNLMLEMDACSDIARLCGAQPIKKYIDPEMQKRDIEKGLAPTPETIHEFAGDCELVESNVNMTKFVNPAKMYEKDENGVVKVDENGDPIPTDILNNLFGFLEGQIQDAKDNALGTKQVYEFKKRLQSLKSNMIEFEVGGITISDRDEAKDLIDDAVKSCRSASRSGVGFGANFEGLRAVGEILEENDAKETPDTGGVIDMLEVILDSYVDITTELYMSVYHDREKAFKLLMESLDKDSPLNLSTGEFDKKVLTSIDTDIKILNAISKIVTLMFTTEQCYVQVPALNHYI